MLLLISIGYDAVLTLSLSECLIMKREARTEQENFMFQRRINISPRLSNILENFGKKENLTTHLIFNDLFFLT